MKELEKIPWHLSGREIDVHLAERDQSEAAKKAPSMENQDHESNPLVIIDTELDVPADVLKEASEQIEAEALEYEHALRETLLHNEE